MFTYFSYYYIWNYSVLTRNYFGCNSIFQLYCYYTKPTDLVKTVNASKIQLLISLRLDSTYWSPGEKFVLDNKQKSLTHNESCLILNGFYKHLSVDWNSFWPGSHLNAGHTIYGVRDAKQSQSLHANVEHLPKDLNQRLQH